MSAPTEPAASHPVLECIRTRRSIFAFRPDPPPESDLLTALEAGIWAPNHHLTQPWRFTIVGHQARARLRERYAELQADKRRESNDDARRELMEKARRKLDGKPVIVAVSFVLDGDEARRLEDYAAVCCAIQNVQLAAWSQGIGMQWSTGALTRDATAYDALEIDRDLERIVGFLYAGYPEKVPRTRRTPFEAVLRRTP